MRHSKSTTVECIIKDIKRKTRKRYSAEEKILVVLDGLRGEESLALKKPSRNDSLKLLPSP